MGASAPALPAPRRPSPHGASGRSIVAALKSSASPSASSTDPWGEWEARWSQEFQNFEQVQRARRSFRRQVEMQEEEEREAEWRRKVESAKRDAEAARAAASSGRPPPQPRRQRPKPEEEAAPGGSSHQRGWCPPPKPPPPPPQPPKAAPVKASSTPSFASFADFSAAWTAFEQKLSSPQKSPLRCSDIPWPSSLPSVSGAGAADTPAEKKKKLRAALMRWHPDKWAPILEQVAEAERPQVMERVKEVTQRILEEKKRFGD